MPAARRHLQSVPPPAGPVPGTWLIASAALDRPVTAQEPYPHVCGSTVVSPPGRPVRLSSGAKGDCWNCVDRIAAEQVA